MKMKVSLKKQVAALTAAMEAGMDHEESLQAEVVRLRNDATFNVAHWKKRDAENADVYTNTLKERDQRVQQLSEEVAQLKEKINIANATCDLVIRMVDQFTSLQITPLNTTTTVLYNDVNSPRSLRKT